MRDRASCSDRALAPEQQTNSLVSGSLSFAYSTGVVEAVAQDVNGTLSL